DYAAALLTQAEAEDDPLLSLDALAACDEALTIDPRLPEALFNRAVALRNLGLIDEAERAFRYYAVSDHSSGWSGEAALNANQLRHGDESAAWRNELKAIATTRLDDAVVRRLVRAYPQQTRS